MQPNDLTQSVLHALASSYPDALHTDTLARLVSCDEQALWRLLRILGAVGAVGVSVTRALSGPADSVAITEAAFNLLRDRG